MWYVVWTEARSEAWLKQAIDKEIDKKLCLECWMPKKTEQQKWQGEIKTVEKMLFPGYLFTDTEDPEKLHIEIRKLKCTSRVMRVGEDFTPISKPEDELIRSLTGEDGVAGISIGVIEDGKLRVIEGPLKGLEKYIVKIDRYKRKAWLKLYLLGEERKISLSLSVTRKS